MQSKLLKSWGAGCVRWLGSYVAGLVLTLFVLVCVVPTLFWFVSYIVDNYDTQTALLILIPVCGGSLLLLFASTLALVAWVFVRRQRQFDGAFLPLGLTGSGYGMTGRQYHGEVQGRRVDVYYLAASGGARGYGSPSQLDLYLGAPLNTSLAVGTKEMLAEAIANMAHRAALSLTDPDWSGRDVFALDEIWALRLLTEPIAKAAILHLTADQGPYELRQFFVRPESLRLRLYRFPQNVITLEAVKSWLNDLLTIAKTAESLPRPQKTEAASPLEHTLRTDRGRYTLIGIVIAVGIVVVVLVCFIAMAGILYFVETQSH